MTSATAEIGMNLASVKYWSTEYPFIDRFKTSSLWRAQDTSYANLTTAVMVDANGYPTGIPAGASRIYAMVELDPVALPTSDIYVLTYSGTAKIDVGSSKIISSEPGKIVFQFTGSTNMTPVNVSAIDPANPITSVSIVRQDQVSLFQSGEVFNPDFLAKASQWSELRYKDWMNVDNSTLSSWSARSTTASASWASNDGTAGGVPIEIMVQLANKTHTDMWLSMPTEADDTYVRKTLEYVRDHLDPSLKVTVEYSNEVWNWGYTQAKYALAMGDKLWGKDVNGDGKIDPNNPAEHVADGWMQYYGYRSAQVAAIARSVFGSSTSDRLATVLSTQTGYPGLEASALAGVQKAGLGDASKLFNDYAIATYFGLAKSDEATVLGWARAGSAGVTAALASLSTSLDKLQTIYSYQQAVAKKNGMILTAYEGGLDLTTYQYSAAAQPEILAFFQTLASDSRMGALYARMISDFAAAGGTTLVAYADTLAASKYGNFGTLDSIYDTTSPRYAALLAAAASAATTTGSTTPTPATNTAVTTTNTSYTLAATDRTLTYTGTALFTGTGNSLDNVLTGGNGGNSLYGGAGADQLIGGTGNDLLDGGTGADRMSGGAGNDTYVVDNAGDVVVELANAGIDEVRTTLGAYTLTDNVENLTFTGSGAFNGAGNALNNTIVGGSGNNTLFGDAGADVLIGGAGNDYLDGGKDGDKMVGGDGNDIYIVDDTRDTVVELANGGTDEVRTSLAGYTLGANVENLTYTGSAAFSGSGNALDNVITGGSGADRLYGGAGQDTLIGGAGDDILSGDAGADIMIGGLGNDSYYVDNINDKIVELASEGTDTVWASVSFTLPNNVEKLYLQGTSALNGFGNAQDNYLVGNSAANTIDGGAGNDVIYGGAGNDILIGGDGNDTLFGDDGNDELRGGSGNDALYGGAGNDLLIGGGGKDYISGGAGADTFKFNPGDLGNSRATTATITDWSHAEGDRIDLSMIDAIPGTSAKDAFRFVGTNAFSKKAGELRIQYSGGYWDVQGDLNGDGIADISLTVVSSTVLVANDFIL